MTVYAGDVIESRPDYLTITAKGDVDRIILEHRAKGILLSEHARGDDLRPLTWRGYDGGQTRHCQYGQRQDSDLLRLSGALAADRLDEVLPLASNVTRLDLCVTCRLPGVTDELIRESYGQGREHQSDRGRAVDYQLLEHSRRGSTLYIGSRASRSYGRLYNKFSESQLDYFRGCFRYEVEAKGELAVALARALSVAPDRGASIQQYVHDHFSERGVEPAFHPTGHRLSVQPYRRRPDDSSRLAWLATQVAPTLERLRKRHLLDAGVQALGLADYMAPLDI